MSHIQSIAAVLSDNGWDATDLQHWHSATRAFATAVGQKEAHAYLRLVPSQPFAYLTGDYWSEGRNILEACMHRVRLDDESALTDAVNAFALDADARVRESYAVRLLRRPAPTN